VDLALVIFIATYIVIAIGTLPYFRIDRTGAAIIGASLMVVSGVLSEREALHAIDFRTLIILFGMMIVVADLRLSGFFTFVLLRMARFIKTSRALLAWLIVLSGVMSALFVNDTICIVFTPFVLILAEKARIDAKPYLLALCMASNIGSAATPTGNPQNIIIASASGISYSTFLVSMLPVVAVSLVICYAVLAVQYRDRINGSALSLEGIPHHYHHALVTKCIVVAFITMILFLMGYPMELVSLGAGAFLLITRRIKPEKVYQLIDFRLLLLFVGLFIVIAGLGKSPQASILLKQIGAAVQSSPVILAVSSALLSNVISNVPAVILFKSVFAEGVSKGTWLLLSMSSTFAGNLTIVGSIANIIVIEGSAHEVKISFFEYMKSGLWVTLLSLLAGTLWLMR